MDKNESVITQERRCDCDQINLLTRQEIEDTLLWNSGDTLNEVFEAFRR